MTGTGKIKHLFAYGTLMRGGLYAGLLARGDVRLVGPARCRGRLYDLGEYPGLVLEGRRWVAGELYRSDGLDRLLGLLDGLEARYSFERRLLEVRWAHGPTAAWGYVYRGSLEGAVPIPGGSYKAHIREFRDAT